MEREEPQASQDLLREVLAVGLVYEVELPGSEFLEYEPRELWSSEQELGEQELFTEYSAFLGR